jgi:peroxiredoxin
MPLHFKLTFLLITIFASCRVRLNAQVSLAQTIGKIENYKNYSYSSVDRKMEVFKSDTITERQQALFINSPQDKSFGYLFRIKTSIPEDKIAYTDLYNGQDLIHAVDDDSSYTVQNKNKFDIQGTLTGTLKWLQSRVDKKLSQIEEISDTSINGIDTYHIVIVVTDTLIDKERNYTYSDLYINKSTGMPDCIIVKARYSTFGAGIAYYYSETHYSGYRFDQNNIDRTVLSIPFGFHSAKEKPAAPKKESNLLVSGSAAPDWTLYDADGKKMSLTRLKGKAVMLDFFFIGCGGCMEALKPLNRLHEKYKGKNIEIVSMTFRDNAKSVKLFKEHNHIEYPIYIEAGDVVKTYHVIGFPTFYYIDKKRKIAAVSVGYSDDFEAQAASRIDSLLND